MPRRPKRDRAARAKAALPKDDRFAAHPNEAIDVVYVMGRAAHLVGARFKVVLGVMLASMAVLALSGFIASGAGVEGATDLSNVPVAMLLAWILSLLLQAPLVGAAIEVHTERRDLPAEFFRRALSNLGALIGASLVVAIIAAVATTLGVFLQMGLIKAIDALPLGFFGLVLGFIGSVTILVLVLRFVTAFSLVVPIILVEGLGAGAALGRSWAMGWRNGSPIFLAVLLPALLAQGVLFLASFMPGFINIPVAIVLGIGLALYNSTIVPAAYVVIREYNEGLNPAHLLRSKRRR